MRDRKLHELLGIQDQGTYQIIWLQTWDRKLAQVRDDDNLFLPITLGATARSYRRQDGADAAARFDKFLPARASLRPPISLKFVTE